MAIMLERLGNQFADSDSWLYCIDTREVIKDENVEIV